MGFFCFLMTLVFFYRLTISPKCCKWDVLKSGTIYRPEAKKIVKLNYSCISRVFLSLRLSYIIYFLCTIFLPFLAYCALKRWFDKRSKNVVHRSSHYKCKWLDTLGLIFALHVENSKITLCGKLTKKCSSF